MAIGARNRIMKTGLILRLLRTNAARKAWTYLFFPQLCVK